jgi:nitrite reductase/ring-hydroxylating ferredoxin subunit
MASEYLCEISDLTDAAVREATIRSDDSLKPVFMIRKDGRIYAYENSYPHIGAPQLPGRFLDDESRHIVCATHAALFRINDGSCMSGPCRGASITPLEVLIRDGSVFAAPMASHG